MGDYLCPPHPLKPRNRPPYSTAGDSTIPQQQWCWPAYSLTQTPSQKRGMSQQIELHERGRAVNLVVQAAIGLALPQLIIATAAVYLHRFYMRKPIQKYPPKEMSATALFLATKVEEVPRKLEYVVKEYLSKDDPLPETSTGTVDTNEFEHLKQKILYYEDVLLRALCFDLAVDHPYVPLVRTVKELHLYYPQLPNLRSPSTSPFDLSDGLKARSLAQSAWSFVNDSLLTPLCVIATPSVIAAAAFLIAVSHRAIESASPETDQATDCDTADQGKPSLKTLALLDNLDVLLLPKSPSSLRDDRHWWSWFGAEDLAEVHFAANMILDQYADSVAPYIREQAGKIPLLPHAPPMPFLSSIAQTVPKITSTTPKTQTDDQLVEPSTCSPDAAQSPEAKAEKVLEDVLQRSTTPSPSILDDKAEDEMEVEAITPDELLQKRPRDAEKADASPVPAKHIKTDHAMSTQQEPSSLAGESSTDTADALQPVPRSDSKLPVRAIESDNMKKGSGLNSEHGGTKEDGELE